MAMREAWDVVRLKAEAKFLLSSAEAVSLVPRKNSKQIDIAKEPCYASGVSILLAHKAVEAF